MSWIRTADEWLLNLDFVLTVDVSELEEPESGYDIGEPTHGVFANLSEDDSHCLWKGDEAYCIAKREQLAAKLSLVKP